MDAKAAAKKLSAVVALSALLLVGCDDTEPEEPPQDVVETTESPAPGIPSGPTDPAMPGGSPDPVLPGDEQETP